MNKYALSTILGSLALGLVKPLGSKSKPTALDDIGIYYLEIWFMVGMGSNLRFSQDTIDVLGTEDHFNEILEFDDYILTFDYDLSLIHI